VKIVDAHCDVLWKVWADPSMTFHGHTGHATGSSEPYRLQASGPLLRKSGVFMQSFAIYIPPSVSPQNRFYTALQMIDLFYRQIVKDGTEWTPFRTAIDLERASRHGKRVAMLTLEGADAVQGDLLHLRTLHRLGVRVAGLTWNFRNEVADGVAEPHPGGLSAFGRQFVEEASRYGMLLDVSHLSEASFWDLLAIHHHPVIASHSNIFEIRNHPRNLKQEQVKAIYATGGCIGLTFVGDFVSDRQPASIDDLLKHLERCCEWGGVRQTGFGSDFDGSDRLLTGLEHAGQLDQLVEALLKRYKEEEVRGFMGENWLRLFRTFFTDPPLADERAQRHLLA